LSVRGVIHSFTRGLTMGMVRWESELQQNLYFFCCLNSYWQLPSQKKYGLWPQVVKLLLYSVCMPICSSTTDKSTVHVPVIKGNRRRPLTRTLKSSTDKLVAPTMWLIRRLRPWRRDVAVLGACYALKILGVSSAKIWRTKRAITTWFCRMSSDTAHRHSTESLPNVPLADTCPTIWSLPVAISGTRQTVRRVSRNDVRGWVQMKGVKQSGLASYY
jgi:hypothetical protein